MTRRERKYRKLKKLAQKQADCFMGFIPAIKKYGGSVNYPVVHPTDKAVAIALEQAMRVNPKK